MLLKVLINENKIQIIKINIDIKVMDDEGVSVLKEYLNEIMAERTTSKKVKKMPKTQNAK